MTSPLPPFRTGARLGTAVFLMLEFATWALTHSYEGIFHDAGLYTLQALAHLHPAALSADVFLKFGSQDGFTVFSPLYAAAARTLGIEPAAALLTLVSQIALLAGAWALARAVLPASMAALGTAVLIAVPGTYGAGRIFTCIEPFLTPRMAAEALVLGGLVAAVSNRRLTAFALVGTAALLHPIMAMAGIGMLIGLYLGKPRPVLTAALVIVGFKALALAAFFMPLGQWGRFDPDWLALVQNRSPYLFLSHWQLADWSLSAVVLATLAIGAARAPEPARTLAALTLATVSCGLVLALIGGDGLHLVIVTQLQPWRWLWLGTVVSALFLPQILSSTWRNGPSGRTVCLSLAAAWVFGAGRYALVAAAAALAALAGGGRLKPGEARWLWFGSCGLLAIALTWRVATDLTFTEAYYLAPGIPLWLRETSSVARGGVAPAILTAAAWWLAQRPRARPALAALGVLGVLGAAACAVLLPPTWRSWTAREFPVRRTEQFAGVRTLIPPNAQVFWPESPVAVWTLLDRPSYLSVLQTSGMVFSRRTAIELERRAEALGTAVSPANFMSWSSGTGMSWSKQQLIDACKTGEFEFLVTSADLGAAALASVPAADGNPNRQIRLYRCPAAAAAAAT